MGNDLLVLGQDSYAPAVQKFNEYIGGRGLLPTPTSVEEYFRWLAASPLSAPTVRVRRCAVKRRLRMMAEGQDAETQDRLEKFLHKLDRDPATKAPKSAPRSVGMEKVIQPDEKDRLQAQTSKRVSLYIEFLYATGCRVSELTGARLDHCKEVVEGFVDVVVRGKGNKLRTVSIARETFDNIRLVFDGKVFLFETRDGAQLDPVFVSRCIRRVGRRVLKRKISAHCFRHSYATIQIRRTNKVEAVSRYLGHANVSTTLGMYVHQDLSRAEAVLA